MISSSYQHSANKRRQELDLKIEEAGASKQQDAAILLSSLRADGRVDSSIVEPDREQTQDKCCPLRLSSLWVPASWLLGISPANQTSRQEARAFAIHQLSLKLRPTARAIVVFLIITSLLITTKLAFYAISLVPQQDQSQDQSRHFNDSHEPMNKEEPTTRPNDPSYGLRTIVQGSLCMAQLSLMVWLLCKVQGISRRFTTDQRPSNSDTKAIDTILRSATSTSINANGTNHKQPENCPLMQDTKTIERIELILLVSSSIFSALMAMQETPLISLNLVTIFILYGLLIVEREKVLTVIMITNLIQLSISNPIFSLDKLMMEQQSARAGKGLIDLNSNEALTNNDNPNDGKWSELWSKDNNELNYILIISIVYVYFHLIGIYLNKKTQDNCHESFNDIKIYVKSKLMMDTEDKKLTKLMESVIPKHLAGRMRTDILLPQNKGIFHRIYLDSFDEVSILFADIVNFTKISSACSAQLLVETLNELFGRFDKAADKNHCLRIKILGDCYYCVSGIPDKSSEHAVRSVEMGLDMIDILGDLANDNSGVDLNMRVGIHSGRVLCGVLGKKKWQFDVHSNDVKLANHTEQSGIPGRVHITEDTLKALGGRYQVEPANGHLRDTFIAQRNMATYFVVPPINRRQSSASQVSASFNGDPLEPTNASLPSRGQSSSLSTAMASGSGDGLTLSAVAGSPTNHPPSSSGSHQAAAARLRFKMATQRLINALHFIRTIDAPFANLETPATTMAVAANQCERLMLQTIKSRCQLQDIDGLTLKFKDKHMSQLYNGNNLKGSSCKQNESITDKDVGHLKVASVDASTPVASEPLVPSGAANRTSLNVSLLNASLAIISLICAILFLLHYTSILSATEPKKVSPLTGAAILSGEQEGQPAGQLSGLLAAYRRLPAEHWTIVAELVALFCISGLVFLHQIEYNSRRDFLWRQIAIRDQDRMSLMRDCNRFIFFNLLPPHVASYFLEQTVSRSHMDLYYKSYDRIGVIFATISNFSDFYSEVQGNNHGLECLRLLNEIICDFDSILDDEKFRSVDKIKTIGSTYMAAIGLFPNHELPTEPITVPDPSGPSIEAPSTATSVSSNKLTKTVQEPETKLSSAMAARRRVADYLHILVSFVIEMRSRLQDINEHSYNFFKLRVGINLGPVTAGVIGASKPQYDIWGNTVNVASRMESTAEPNKIQITEDVYEILKDFNDSYNFKFVCRGSINVKGKGFMTTYYLEYD